MKIGIVGAGMAGLACAEGLAGQGHDVALFDKGRGPGGRMSTRRVPTLAGEASFDHGAQYFTVRDAAFRARVDDWLARGAVAPWPAAGEGAYVGVPAMNAPIRQMAEGQSARWATPVTRLERSSAGWRLVLGAGESIVVDIAVVATPAEQAAALLASVAPDFAGRAASAPSAPCWTAMLAFAETLPTAVDCLEGGEADILGWAARNRSKPGRTGPEAWVLQAGPDWSRRHLEADAEWVALALSAAFSQWLGLALPATISRGAHRWRYARAGVESVEGSGALWDADRRLGLCGDWLVGARVEGAWMSGTLLAGRIAAGPREAGAP
ncbi:FAD-dependent oxidoreductase [uncultured Rhodoblastus sp.]|uniref:NAD(P)/FAD-dependent oxidoreductase n=1 Tax=uncultured Rhodoblastus sp. TaxID=543037 RepID=UPI0025F9F173|nr:FAD-dependent oxidoreductase [uncultured Rhodoblastus sp.]